MQNVKQNFSFSVQDHVGLGGLTFVIDEPVSFTRRRFTTMGVGMEYIMNERGPMTNPGVEGVAFVNTKYADPDGQWPGMLDETKFSVKRYFSTTKQVKH